MKPVIQLLALVSLLLFAVPAPANEFFAMDNALGDVKTLAGKAALLKELGYKGPVGVIGYGLIQPAREHLRQSIQILRKTIPS